MKRELSAAALAGAFLIAGSSTAFAVDSTGYPSVGPVCEVGSGTTEPDEEFDVDCDGFAPTITVNITIRCEAAGAASGSGRVLVTATGTTTGQGAVTWTGSIPDEGICVFTAASGGGSGSARVVVDAPRAVTTASVKLAQTGLESSALLWGAGGLGAIGLGTAGILASRRRTSTTE
jgi:LPXTG-motif cell wall-anchored protein